MIRFRPAIVDDVPQILSWISADLDHAGKMSAEWWLAGSILSCCAEDAAGSVMYLRIDRELSKARMHIQFAPHREVSKIRVAGAFIEGLPRMAQTMKDMGFGSLVFESVSPSLIGFMGKMGFSPAGGNDFVRT